MRNFFTVLLFAVSALASPQPQITSSGESSGSVTNPDADASAASAASALVAAIPSSILTVMETAIPASWQDEVLTDPAFRSSVASAAAAGTYPAWYNELPSSVKAWASSNFDAQILGVSTTSQGVASETGSYAVTTGAAATQSVSNASQITSSGSSSADSAVSGSTSASSAAASSAKSTGGAPAPTSGIAMGVAGAAGVLALALAL
ncbi:uncharacterized protein N7496_008395 [Penicillium cataractarum]|uniref:Uncharacterized protein n=1 Tax=Penicillium cataractarum TaxID=2100454 RepID=A0A9W9V6V9_9EURO|nr:uncharacterized protein N7496_008395 [Penicillium cataractarum]KAJ5368635.1 hypothetical protein N7496_008395 [Penicillium cataractarum]